MEITREQFRERAREKVKSLEFSITQTAFADSRAELEEELELARIALASHEAEPVAWLLSGGGAKNHVSFDSGNAYADPLREVTPLYTAPPAPVSVPDEDLLHMAASAIEDLLSNKDRYCAGVWADIPAKLRRAAMLQGSDGTLTNEGTITATQFKPVADLYGLTSPTGGETSFTFDAVEARDFIDGGWSCQEYVELERFQEAVSGNSPVIPDGWVLVPVEPTAEMLQSGISAHYERSQIQIHDRPAPGPMECAYVAMLAAAPQQEVK